MEDDCPRSENQKMMKEHVRHLRLDYETEQRLFDGARVCRWRKGIFELFRDMVILMRHTGETKENFTECGSPIGLACLALQRRSPKLTIVLGFRIQAVIGITHTCGVKNDVQVGMRLPRRYQNLKPMAKTTLGSVHPRLNR